MVPDLSYRRIRWPDAVVPAGEPLWLHYEISQSADAVVRSIDVFQDGRVERHSLELEQRANRPCVSLIGCSVKDGFDGLPFDEQSREDFEALWRIGVDTPLY